MKILVVAPTPFFSDRGTHIRILEEALALEKMGHDITIATYHIGRDIHQERDTGIDVRRIIRLLFWYKKLEAGPDWQKIVLDLMLIRKTFYLARKHNPDIIHGHLHEGALIGWIVKKLLFWKKIKLVCDFHGSLTREMESHSYLNSGILKGVFHYLEKIINNLGDFSVASSWEYAEELKKTRRSGNIETVLDGVNLDYYVDLPPKEDCKKELELPLNKTVVTYAGALVANKGIDFLYQSILLVQGRCPDAFFIIAGFPIMGAEKFVAENKLEDKVRLINPLDYFELPKILKASDIGIDPKDSSVRQASGKILQYMAARLPVACFDRPNNRNYLGGGGEYAGEINSQSLADAIINLVNNPSMIRAKGEISRQRAENFSWEKTAEKINIIYKNLNPKAEF